MNKWTVAFLAVFIVVASSTFATGDPSVPATPAPAISRDATVATCDFAPSGKIVLKARWIAKTITCDSGEYLPKKSETCATCETNNYCVGGPYSYSETTDQGIEPCDNNLKSPAGSKSENDCGHILHVGNSIIYLHKQNADMGKPRLAVKVGTQTYYANMTPVADGAKQMTSGSDITKLHIKFGDTEYTVFDNSVFYQE